MCKIKSGIEGEFLSNFKKVLELEPDVSKFEKEIGTRPKGPLQK
jgi:hypothetical protein